MVTLSATDAARSFSDVLNRVAAGEEFEILRNGAPVAYLGPSRVHAVSAARLNDLLARLPAADDDFAADLRAIRADQGVDGDPWAS
jgi:prevent-host-death family protein